MTVKLIVFEPFKASYIKEVAGELKDYQNIVEGYIETVYIGQDDMVLVCNEEGLLDELPKDRGYHGTFFIVGVNDSEFVSLTDDQIKAAKEMFENKKNYECKNKFLQQYFEEKEVEYRQFNYDTKSGFVSIDTPSIVQEILKISDIGLLNKIEMMIRKIDFKNGDIHHYLEHLGRAMADAVSL